VTGPYLVRHLEPGEPARCDAITTRDEQCTLPATVRYVGGPNDGRVDCTRHGNDRDRHRQPIDAPVVVSVKAFETLDRAQIYSERLVLDRRDRIVKQAEEAGDAVGAKRAWDAAYWPSTHARSLPAEGGKVGLPDGSEIVVEETTWTALWRETGKPWLTFHSASPAAVVRIFNEWAAERYGTEARR